MPTLLLSTCGTSSLTNHLRAHPVPGFHGGHLNQLTNYARLEEMPEGQRANVSQLLDTARERLPTLDAAAAALASAEINGITRVEGGLEPGTQHYLLATDTYVGRATAGIIKAWLSVRGLQAAVFPIEELNTNSSDSFMAGAKNLLEFVDGTVAEFGESHRVVFNLTGGFKSLLGMMTTLGAFYADEIVYVFESGDDLIRIPRLPIRLDNGLFRDHAAALLRMSRDEYLPEAEVQGLPGALLEAAGEGRYGLSVWGELLWKRNREDILSDDLQELPYLRYETSFVDDYRKLQKPQRVEVQETLARVSALLATSKGSREALLGHRAGSLKYEQFSGNKSAYGHFRLSGGRRVSCEPTAKGLTLRHVGEHDYVNDRP